VWQLLGGGLEGHRPWVFMNSGEGINVREVG